MQIPHEYMTDDNVAKIREVSAGITLNDIDVEASDVDLSVASQDHVDFSQPKSQSKGKIRQNLAAPKLPSGKSAAAGRSIMRNSPAKGGGGGFKRADSTLSSRKDIKKLLDGNDSGSDDDQNDFYAQDEV